MRVFLCKIIGGGALCSVISFASSTSGSTSSGSTLTAGSVPIEPDGACNLNEPWQCSEYTYYETHTCTLNNVCIFNEYSFLESGDFHNKMTHHCHNLPFDCNYFHEIKQCRTRYCATQTLCNLDVDGYEICLIKALLCYDEYCEPDLSSLPFDYRLYDLCCHINNIDDGVSRFHTWLVMILGVIAMVIVLSLYEIYSAFTKHSVQKLSFNLYKKVKYFVKYVIRNYISIKLMRQNIEYCSNEMCKKIKKLKRNVKYHYKNNKMMWCFLNLFDEYFVKMTDANIGSISIPLLWTANKEQKQHKNGDSTQSNTTTITEEGNKPNTNHSTKKSKGGGSNKKKRKVKETHSKKRKKAKTKHKSSNATKKVHNTKETANKQLQTDVIQHVAMESTDEQEHDTTDNESIYDDEGKGECKELSDHEIEGETHPHEDEDDEMEEETHHDKMIEMNTCPSCGAMNAEYLSNCDQCKCSMVSKGKKKKKNKKKQKKKSNNKCNGEYWQCVQCTYHNQNKWKKCQMCQSSKEESKFSTKCTKKSKKKRVEKMHGHTHKDRHKNSHHHPHNHHHHTPTNHSHSPVHQIHLNQSKKYYKNGTNAIVIHSPKSSKYVATRKATHHHKPTNSLNPNAKEFIYETKPIVSPHNHIDHGYAYSQSYDSYEYDSYDSYSPSRRLSKIPRLQKSVNPEPDYVPRHGAHHTRSHNMYCDDTIEHDTPHHIPPRFQTPPFDNNPPHTLPSPPAAPPPPPPVNITLITQIAPIIPAPPAELPPIDNAELQRQLSDMEANVHKQLEVLDTLFPAIKPDLSQEIQAMQENMKA